MDEVAESRHDRSADAKYLPDAADTPGDWRGPRDRVSVVRLLRLRSRVPHPETAARRRAAPKWVLVAVCCVAVALGFAFTLMPGSNPANIVAPISDLPAANLPRSPN